tara:strand:- start:25 stop:459 length:435 start_codon:yes stop_codon:yes gene_type:complete
MKTREDREELLTNLREGMSIQAACALSGISRATYYMWLDKDEEWAEEVEFAKRFAEPVLLSRIKSCAAERGEWRAYAWILERRWPQEWGPKQEIEINQTTNDGGADMVRQMIEQTDRRVMESTHEENTDLADSELVEPTSSPEE